MTAPAALVVSVCVETLPNGTSCYAWLCAGCAAARVAAGDALASERKQAVLQRCDRCGAEGTEGEPFTYGALAAAPAPPKPAKTMRRRRQQRPPARRDDEQANRMHASGLLVDPRVARLKELRADGLPLGDALAQVDREFPATTEVRT